MFIKAWAYFLLPWEHWERQKASSDVTEVEWTIRDQFRNVNTSKWHGSSRITSLQISQWSNFSYASLAHSAYSQRNVFLIISLRIFIQFPVWDVRSRRWCFICFSIKEFIQKITREGLVKQGTAREILTILSLKERWWIGLLRSQLYNSGNFTIKTKQNDEFSIN